MNKTKLLSNIKGDLSGAISAAIISIPLSIGYGIIVYKPLGAEFIPFAALLGIYACLFGGIFASLLGGTDIQITAPKAPLTLLLASFVAPLAANLQISDAASRQVIIVGLASICVFAGGIIQFCFGALRLGNLIKYVPYPVVSGFMNGIALILIYEQLAPLIGAGNHISIIEILSNPSVVQPFTLLVGLTTIIAVFLSKRFFKAIPASLVGLVIGTAVFYTLKMIGGVSTLGPVIGNFSFQWPKPDIFLKISGLITEVDIVDLLPSILITGIVLGSIGSLESLLSSVAADNFTGTRHKSNKELMGQGIGNIINSLFSALPSAGSELHNMANYRAGARTRLSGLVCGLLIFLIVLTLASIIGKIPLAVIAGIIVSVGLGLFDKWTLDLFRNLLQTHEQQKRIIANLAVTIVVAVITVCVNLIVAVLIGIAIASGLFIVRMGRSIIKRKYYGDQIHSKKVRSIKNNTLLKERGKGIIVYELRGPLFFGSADNLAMEIESAMNHYTYCILDMKRVSEIDSTGAKILSQISKKLNESGKYLLISHMTDNPALAEFLKAMGVYSALAEDCFFPDTDAALEWAEDNVLTQSIDLAGILGGIELEQMDILKDFTQEEIHVLKQKLTFKTFKKGEIIVREGDTDRNLFFLTKGSVSVRIHLPESDRYKRLITYSPGVAFGEIAFLDGRPRSADVWSDEESETYLLSPAEYAVLQNETPEIAVKLVRNIALDLSERLRIRTNEVRVLEEG
ncbi:MAG: SLC26A/SulP transporter family protein [Desulfobacterales bacterium]|jgi:MFS superfamily sulfate permease-like transporter